MIDTRRRSALGDGTLALVAVFTVWVNSGFAKPIWIDEFLHFAMGSMPTLDALRVIRDTTGAGVNWGQTGTYFLFNHFGGALFGANLWILRLPSILAGILLLLSAVWFIRCRGLHRGWQLLTIATLGAQQTLMHYVGEARPYMPMAAAAVAVVAYYSTNFAERKRFVARLIGVAGIVVGAAFHPYWLPFTAVGILYGYWFLQRQDAAGRVWSLRQFLALPLLLPAVVIYVLSGVFTWMKARTGFRADPFEVLGSPLNAFQVGFSVHFEPWRLPGFSPEFADRIPQFLPGINTLRLPAFALLVLLLGLAILNVQFRRVLAEPLMLLGIGIGSSLALALLSYSQEYWVAQRQWVGGIAIVTVALVWAVAKAWYAARAGGNNLVGLFLMGAIVLSSLQAGDALYDSVYRVVNHADFLAQYSSETGAPNDVVRSSLEIGDPSFAANVNVSRGGSIWPDHSLYYGVAPSR